MRHDIIKIMRNIISRTSLKKIENIRKYVLIVSVWALVGAVVAGVLLIVFGGNRSGEIIDRLVATLFIVSLMMLVSVNNFRRITSKNSVVQVFALVGLCSNVVWAISWTLLCWNPEWALDCAGPRDNGIMVYASDIAGLSCVQSILIKFASAFSYLSALGFIGSNVLSIYEGNKRDLIKPLKIAAVVCATYDMLYFAIMSFVGFESSIYSDVSGRFLALAGFVFFAWVIIVIVALTLSKSEKNKKFMQEEVAKKEKLKQETVSDKKTNAEIEEQVCRDIIEKEVRARMEVERSREKADK